MSELILSNLKTWEMLKAVEANPESKVQLIYYDGSVKPHWNDLEDYDHGPIGLLTARWNVKLIASEKGDRGERT